MGGASRPGRDGAFFALGRVLSATHKPRLAWLPDAVVRLARCAALARRVTADSTSRTARSHNNARGFVSGS